MKKEDAIKDKMIELMLIDLKARLDGYTLEKLREEYYETAVKLVERSWLTPNQRLRLKEKIYAIESATGRSYTGLMYGRDEKTYLSFANSTGQYRVDVFAPGFLSFMDGAFKQGILYSLGDLLEEKERCTR